MMNPDRLLPARRPLSSPRLRLLCLPYAGGAATIFFTWSGGLPQDVDVRGVQLPGRQDAFNEPVLHRVTDIVDRILHAVALLPPAPLVLYGHSFGAVVAFELARALAAAGKAPGALIVGARRAPHLPGRLPPMHLLPTAAFKEELHRRYGTPRTLLENEELMELALPSLRADLTALETYEYAAGPPLDSPISVLRGQKDRSVSSEDATAWRQHSARATALHEVDGGHFFVETHRPWVLERVAEVLRSV